MRNDKSDRSISQYQGLSAVAALVMTTTVMIVLDVEAVAAVVASLSVGRFVLFALGGKNEGPPSAPAV
jgi:hypothetical protein